MDLSAELQARLGTPLARARTLPGAWYADPEHHRLEMDAVFARSWVGVAPTGAVAGRGSYLATHAANGAPVLITRDDTGHLRAFLNVCRHRGSPVASGAGTARAFSCPYHGWVYRPDGTLARSSGLGCPAGIGPEDLGLTEIGVTTFARSVLVNLDPDRQPFDPGPLAVALEPYRLDELEVGHTSRYERAFNWKVLLENYCENYHTPFIHSQLPAAAYDYPIECAGPVVFAWDRPRQPRDAAEQALHAARPGDPGWSGVAAVAAAESFNNGAYLGCFPNVAVSAFAGFAATFRLLPSGVNTTVVEREYLWHRSVPAERRQADLDATQAVVDQDLAMCELLQRTYDAGLSANGVLSTEHESGVAHIHQLLLAALSVLRSPKP